MTPERWSRIKSVLAEALALPANQRAACLELAAGADPTLRGEVESLLAAEERAGSRFLNTPALALEPAPPNGRFVGRRIGPYQLLAAIGAGGMGEVYRAARTDEYHQEVAIKLVRAGRDFFFGERLRTERQILASFQHPNIARLLDGGRTEDGVPYLVMELVDGKPITQYCDEQSLDTSARLKLFIHVCAAVQYAHQRMVIHRDLKPSNILVTAQGVPKLLDFGIAKILEPGAIPAGEAVTIAAMRVLTPEYASPEHMRGEPVSAASDIYSMGVILYELLTGVRPYLARGRATGDALQATLDIDPKRPSAVREGSPSKLSRLLRGDLDNIALMALRREPERRYATADQLAEDIRRHLQHRPVLARKATLRYRASRFIRRHTAGVAAFLVVALAVGVGIAMVTREAHIAELQRASAEAQRVLAERRFNDVRKLANSLIFDIDDSIRYLPGAAASRGLLINTALQYLDGLSRDAIGNPALQSEMAAAYERLGDIQGRMEASTDQYSEAVKSLERALVLRRAGLAADPTNADMRRAVLGDYSMLGNISWMLGDGAKALSYSADALATARGFTATNLASPRYARIAPTMSVKYGVMLAAVRGDMDGALTYIHPALETLESLRGGLVDDVLATRDLSVAHYRAGEVLFEDHRYAEALSMDENARAVLKEVLIAAPGNVTLRVQEAAAEHFAAASLMELGRLDEALRYEQSALAHARSLAASDPRIAEYRGFVGMGLAGLADIAERQRQPMSAISRLREALEAIDDALRGGTIHPEIRYAKAKAESLMGSAYTTLSADSRRSSLQRARDWRNACRWNEQAWQSFEEITPIWFEAGAQARRVKDEIRRCNPATASSLTERSAADR
jgi:tetratricopeptide (TPR) repeat protein